MIQPTLWQLWSVSYSNLMLQRNLMPRGAWVLCEPKEIFTWLLTLSEISIGRNYCKEKDHKPSHHILRQIECLTSLWIDDVCAKDIETSSWSTVIIIISLEHQPSENIGKVILKLYPSLIDLPGSYLLLQEFSFTSLFSPIRSMLSPAPFKAILQINIATTFGIEILYTFWMFAFKSTARNYRGFLKNHVNIHCLLVFTYLLELEFSNFKWLSAYIFPHKVLAS